MCRVHTRRYVGPGYENDTPDSAIMMAISLHQISIENAMRCIDMGSDTSAIRLDPRGPPSTGARPFQDHDVSPRMVNGRSMERPAHRVASVTSVRPARRCAPIARLRRAAMTLGPDRVLTWDLSS